MTAHTRGQLTIAGHRGAKTVAPENTMEGYRRGIADGADQLELDVRLTRDGRMALIHDATVDRTTDGVGPVAEKSWEELQSFDAGGGERIPELRQVWDAFPGIDLQVEIKDPAATADVLDLARREPHPGGVTVTSFHPEVVAEALAADGPWQVGLIAGLGDAEKLARGLAEHGDDERFCLMVHLELADRTDVTEFRQRGGATYLWPIDDEAGVVRALEDGWTGITMDDPAVGAAARSAWLSSAIAR